MGIRVAGITAPQLGFSIGQWVKRNTVSVALGALREEVDRGFDNRPVVITDGMPRRSPEDVKPFGRIVFTARPQMAEVVLWALDQLRKTSPVLTGRYVQSHHVLVNGREIEGNNIALALRNVKDTDRVQIVNDQPYARKIEGATANKKTGRGKRKPSSRQAKGGVYRAVLRALVGRYSKSMFFDYTMVKLNTGVKVWGDQGGAYRRSGTRRAVKRVLRDQVYPCLKFFIKPTGLPN